MAALPPLSYEVVLATSFMLSRGSALSGQRRMHGAKTMASELGDMRLWASSLHTLEKITGCECDFFFFPTCGISRMHCNSTAMS